MIPILAVVCIGGALAVLFLFAGCVFGCCRSCGKCGASEKSEEKILSFEKESNGQQVWKVIALISVLLVFTLALL